MSQSGIIFLAALLGVIGFIGFAWQIFNSRGYAARTSEGTPPKRWEKNRSSDARQLTGQEKNLVKDARRLIASGDAKTAAQILEQLHMHREAIAALEDNGNIHEAARILFRLQRPNRAGVVYARHGMWEPAAEAFKVAKMPLEAARSYREAGREDLAAVLFENAGQKEEAAECYLKSKQLQKAARLFADTGDREKAMQLYRRLAEESRSPASLSLTESEVRAIVEYISEGHTVASLTDILVSRNKLMEAIQNLLQKNLIVQAAEVYVRSSIDIGPILMAEVGPNELQALRLAEMFTKVQQFKYAGMMFEKLEQFDPAAENFEKADAFDRAAYCYERAGNSYKAHEMQTKHKNLAAQQVLPVRQAFAGNEKTQVPGADKAARAAAPLGQFSLKDIEEQTAEIALPNTPAQVFPPAQIKMDDGKSVFHRSSFFADFDFDQVTQFWNAGYVKDFRAEELILSYGKDPLGLYTILSGRVSCFRQVSGREVFLDQMGEGDCFGELWLLADQPTSVRFVAGPGTRIHILERTPFMNLIEKDVTLARKLYKQFTQRLLKRLVRPKNYYEEQRAS